MSIHNKGSCIHNAIEAGVKGYVLKNIIPIELRLAINRIMEGGTYYSQDIFNTMTIQFVSNPKQEGIMELSRTEKHLLSLLSEGPTNDEIESAASRFHNFIISVHYF